MGIGCRTETFLRQDGPASAASGNSNNFLQLSTADLVSVIFGCKHSTYDECIQQLLFGLPYAHIRYVEKIQPGMPLFLFNYSDRKLHGIFEADGHGALNINPYGWSPNGSEKTQYPAQVQVRVRQTCAPIHEKVFKEIISGNYFTPGHFYFELNHIQTNALIALFTKNVKSSLNNSYPKLREKAESVEDEDDWMKPKKTVRSFNRKEKSEKYEDDWIKSKKTGGFTMSGKQNEEAMGHKDDWIKPNKTAMSTMTAWHNAAPFIPFGQSSGKFEESSAIPGLGVAINSIADPGESSGVNVGDDWVDYENFEVKKGEEKWTESSVDESIQQSLDWRLKVLSGKENGIPEEGSKKLEKEQVLEKLKRLQQVRTHASAVVKAEAPSLQNYVQSEPPTPPRINVNQPNALVLSEWEKMARERCLQEQSMLRKERDQLREFLQSLDAPVAKAISKNLELCASAIAQMRQNEIEVRHIMDEVSPQAELVRELDQLKKKNAVLEYTQVQMASELELLKMEVSKLSKQLESSMQRDKLVPDADIDVNTFREETQIPVQQVYILGGHDGHSWLASVDVLCPARHEYYPVASMLTPRSYAASSVLMGQIYIFGGGNGKLWYETVEMYDSVEDIWRDCPPMNLKRGSLAGATIGDRIFAVGGGNGQLHFSDVECYDPHLGMWISSTSMLNKRFCVAAAELDGVLYAIGGYNDQKYLASVERFDPREALWTAVAPMNIKRGSLSATTLGGKIYAIGGYDGSGFLSSVEMYEPRTNAWLEMETGMHTGRAYGAAARVDDCIYMFGGLNSGPYVDTVECYRENTGWEVVEDLSIGGRCFLSCAVLESS